MTGNIFVYKIQDPKSMIKEYSTCPDHAQDKSLSGSKVTSRMYKRRS